MACVRTRRKNEKKKHAIRRQTPKANPEGNLQSYQVLIVDFTLAGAACTIAIEKKTQNHYKYQVLLYTTQTPPE